VLKWLTLGLLSYFGVLLVVEVHWAQLARAVILPHWSFGMSSWLMVVAILGTTISPYLFFWQAQQEVEESARDVQAQPLRQAVQQAPAEFARIRIDTMIGMAVSNLIALCIVVSTAATLHVHGVTTIESAAQAAEALRAVAGRLTFVVFAVGIIGTGLLTLPILAASAAYSVGELLAWRVGLSHKPQRARAFYTTIAVATLLGCALNFIHINPIRALYWSAVLNGVVAVPVMIAMMHLSAQPHVMGSLTLPRTLRWLGWASTGAMTLTVLAMLVAWLL
jgi:Mn2+/Fe2+ NRAMP family transporter